MKEYTKNKVEMLEDFAGSADSAITTVIHELLIKHDIEMGRISLFDWASIGMKDDISFGMREVIEDEERYFFMKVHPDGSVSFEEQKMNLFAFNDYTDCVNIFSDLWYGYPCI